MKKIILLLLLSCSLGVFAQKKEKTEAAAPSAGLPVVITSQDEYNFMTKGYKVQIESGLDMKKGYSVDDLLFMDKGNYTFDFKGLIKKEGANNRLVGIIVVANSKVWGNKYYFGIPVGNTDLIAQYNTEIAKLDEPMTTAYAECLAPLMSGFLSSLLDCSTNAK